MNISVVWSDQIEDYLHYTVFFHIFGHFWSILVPPWCQNNSFSYKTRFSDLKSTNFDVLHFDLNDYLLKIGVPKKFKMAVGGHFENDV